MTEPLVVIFYQDVWDSLEELRDLSKLNQEPESWFTWSGT